MFIGQKSAALFGRTLGKDEKREDKKAGLSYISCLLSLTRTFLYSSSLVIVYSSSLRFVFVYSAWPATYNTVLFNTILSPVHTSNNVEAMFVFVRLKTASDGVAVT